ncbi:hypothetical protein cypCar_00018668 [Cyprinus carpio]|nr:hypothetical protein cypCar_00018668 [Cyprinus carpio]
MWRIILLCCALEGSVAFRPPANASLLAPVRGVVRTVDRIYHGGGKAGYLLYIDEQRFQLDMERDESILSHHFGLNADAPPRQECVYRGTVNSNAESLALFNLCGGGLDGFFAVDDARYTVTPLTRADATRALHYYTRESFGFEAMPARHSCGTRDRKARNARRQFAKRDALTRRKRSVSRARHVELLLVADASMTKKYGKDLHHYLLTLASIASKLYGHASIENPIRLSVVKVAILSENEKGIEVSKNAAATLKSFCKWQNQQNPLDDDHQHHHDAAILFTRQVKTETRSSLGELCLHCE